MATVGVPQIGVYMAKTSKPTDSVLNFDTDITQYVRKIGYRRGRNNPLNEINPGSGDATIDDVLRLFDPANTASQFYPNIVPMRPLQMRAALAIPADSFLTVSGNEITDAVRAALVQGDGRAAPDSSFGIWEATTNLCTNGGFETNTTGWATQVGTETIVRTTAEAKFGAASLSVQTPGGVGSEGARMNSVTVTASQTHTASAWVKGAGTISVSLNERDAADANVGETVGTAVALTSSWQRITVSRAFGGTGVKARIKVITSGAQAVTFYVDGAQLEQKPIATPYVETNGGTASRSAARVQAPQALLAEIQGWAAVRLRMGWPSTTLPNAAPIAFEWRNGTQNQMSLYRVSTTNWGADFRRNGTLTSRAVAAAHSAGDFVTAIIAWTDTTVYLSINGAAFVSTARGGSVGGSALPSTFEIGNRADSSLPIDSDVLWFACGKGTLTDADAKTIFNYGNTPPDASALLWPAATLPTAVWQADTSAYRYATDAALMTQFVERWPRKRIGRNYAERNITTIDGFDLLSLAGLAGKTYSSSLSGTMIASILNDANWSASLRSLSAGKASIDTQTFNDEDDTKALSLIQQIVGAGGENGIFYINGRGVAVFLDRQAQITAPYSSSKATFTDLVTMAGEFGVTDIQPTSDKDLIVNDWSGTRPGSGTQRVIDSASFLKFGRRSKQIDSLLTTDADTLNSMTYEVSIYKDPLQRIEKITIKPGEYAELWIQCLSREIGDRITVKEHPPGGGQADINDYIIQGIEARFDIGPVSSAVYTWSLFPAPALSFILDDLMLGRLDNNRVGY